MLKEWLRRGFFFVAIGFMVVAVITQWQQIGDLSWSFKLHYLVISIHLLLLVFFLDAYGWHLLLRLMNAPIPLNTSLRIWFISSVARYIPGGIWSYTSRVGMAQEAGVAISVSSVSLYLETLLLMASSLAVGLPALIITQDLPFEKSLTLLIFIVLGLALHPKVIGLLRYLPGKVGRCIDRMVLPSMYSMFLMYLYYVLLWLMLSAGFAFFVASLFELDVEQAVYVGASLSLSFFVGFVLVFAPGGIGVREPVLYLLLLPHLNPASSLLVAIGSRLWIMFGEGVSLIIVLLLHHKTKKDSQDDVVELD